MKKTIFNILGLLFMAETVITASPVNIGDKWLELPLHEKLVAWNSGASIRVDVTSMANGVDDTYKLDKMFPSQTIVAVLQDNDGKEHVFVNERSYVFSQERVYLKMMSDREIEKKTKYVKLKVKSSSVRLTNVSLIWINAGM